MAPNGTTLVHLRVGGPGSGWRSHQWRTRRPKESQLVDSEPSRVSSPLALSYVRTRAWAVTCGFVVRVG